MKNTFIADLIAFVEREDLPPSLYPFVRPSNCKEMAGAGKDVRLVVFKIRGTIDSYHTIIVKNGINIQQVEDKICKDLGMVRLSENTLSKLKELLEKFQRGEFAYFLNHRVDNEKYPYRH